MGRNMLLSFSVTNFRSFRDGQTLNLLASKRLGTPEAPHCCVVPGTGEHVLRVASLYGANGAGKSNVVQALRRVERLVRNGTPPGEPIFHNPFVLDDESAAKPSSFELQFLEEGEAFRYGMCYDADRIHEEWLDVYEGKKERNIFTRASTEKGTVTVSLGPAAKGASHSHSKMKALAEVGARPNQLFLTEVVNLDDPEAQGSRFRRAIKWFKSTLTIMDPDPQFLPLAQTIASHGKFLEFAGRFLREASTGIAALEVQTQRIPRSEGLPFPSRFAENIVWALPKGAVAVQSTPNGEELFFQGTGGDQINRRRIVALHDCGTEKAARLLLHEESDGSRRLLKLLPFLYRLTRQAGVIVIDELERSMHPMLARKFIEFFLKAADNSESQLIFSTHESTLLDLDLMRRDGIWFTEKDQEGATHLYSLADFKVRKDLRIEKGYLEGRFGAIPFLGGIDRLMEEQSGAEARA
jgi:AAA15 family ATPase/GTPase